MSAQGEGKLKPLKWYKNLASRKGRLEAGAFLVEGERAIRQVISSSPDSLIEILSAADSPPVFPGYPVRLLTESQINSISSTKTPQGIIGVVRPPAELYWDHLPDSPGPRILLLEDVQDPGNVGTLIRTAAAFDYSGVILSGKCADPLSPKCVQSSAGTMLSLWIRRADGYMGLVAALKQGGYTITAAELGGSEDLAPLRDEKLVLALGNESSGLSEDILKTADHRLRIPVIREKAESLNVAACGAICIYLSARK